VVLIYEFYALEDAGSLTQF